MRKIRAKVQVFGWNGKNLYGAQPKFVTFKQWRLLHQELFPLRIKQHLPKFTRKFGDEGESIADTLISLAFEENPAYGKVEYFEADWIESRCGLKDGEILKQVGAINN